MRLFIFSTKNTTNNRMVLLSSRRYTYYHYLYKGVIGNGIMLIDSRHTELNVTRI